MIKKLGFCFVLFYLFCIAVLGGLQDKLQNLAGEHSDVLENLSPNVRRRVEVLREMQVCLQFLTQLIGIRMNYEEIDAYVCGFVS